MPKNKLKIKLALSNYNQLQSDYNLYANNNKKAIENSFRTTIKLLEDHKEYLILYDNNGHHELKAEGRTYLSLWFKLKSQLEDFEEEYIIRIQEFQEGIDQIALLRDRYKEYINLVHDAEKNYLRKKVELAELVKKAFKKMDHYHEFNDIQHKLYDFLNEIDPNDGDSLKIADEIYEDIIKDLKSHYTDFLEKIASKISDETEQNIKKRIYHHIKSAFSNFTKQMSLLNDAFNNLDENTSGFSMSDLEADLQAYQEEIIELKSFFAKIKLKFQHYINELYQLTSEQEPDQDIQELQAYKDNQDRHNKPCMNSIKKFCKAYGIKLLENLISSHSGSKEVIFQKKWAIFSYSIEFFSLSITVPVASFYGAIDIYVGGKISANFSTAASAQITIRNFLHEQFDPYSHDALYAGLDFEASLSLTGSILAGVTLAQIVYFEFQINLTFKVGIELSAGVGLKVAHRDAAFAITPQASAKAYAAIIGDIAVELALTYPIRVLFESIGIPAKLHYKLIERELFRFELKSSFSATIPFGSKKLSIDNLSGFTSDLFSTIKKGLKERAWSFVETKLGYDKLKSKLSTTLSTKELIRLKQSIGIDDSDIKDHEENVEDDQERILLEIQTKASKFLETRKARLKEIAQEEQQKAWEKVNLV